ncbi:ADP-ribosyltransferase [Streptomyces sp. NPDC059569]|uniref:ADP-ribosyltransferase n=1 Tax=Streptomyces sp. NPDC059569 TaxID=3346869 RepID=UPI00367B7E0D
MPRSLAVTRVLLYLMFALTLLGGFGVVNSLLELGSHITPTLTLLALYAVVPGIAAVILARRVWTGGKVVWGALIALQGWLLVGSIVNLYAGSARGISQLLLPGALLALVSAGASRAWFELPSEQRAVRPRWTLERLRREGIPSVPHVIGWRRDRGQSAAEYAGMVGLVALIIGALVLGGVGTQIANGLQTAVCTILGSSCESDTVAGGGGESGGGESGGGGDSAGGNNGGGDSGGDSGGGGSDGGGSDGGGSDGGGSDGGGSDGGGSDGGGSDGGSDSGGSDGGGSDGGGSDGGGSDGGGSDGGSSNGGSDSGGSDGGGSDSGGSDSGGSDSGGSDGGSSDGGSDSGGSDGGGSDGGSDSGGSDGGGSDGGGSDGGSDSGGSDGGGSDGGGSDGGGSSGGTNCNPVMAPWGIMQSCTESNTGGSDSGGSDGGGSDGGSSDGGSDSGGSDGGGSNGGSDGGGSDGGGSDGGGSDGGGSDGGSDSGGSSGGTNCNPVMAPWGIMQNCTESNTGGSDSGGGASGGSGGSSGGRNDDNKDDDNKDDDQDEDQDDDNEDNEDNEDKKNDCLNGSKVAFSGPVSTGAAGDGRYTLASAAVRTRVGTGGVLVGGVSLAADPGSASAMDLVQSVSGSSLAGVDTYQDAEDRVVTALGLTDEPRPEPEPDPEPEPEPEPGPDGESCSERPDPMTALDGIPKYGSTDRKDWARKVEEIARQNPLTKDFTAEDALIVADYTGSWAEDANKYLRGQPIPGSRSNSVPKFIERMDRALDHLPPVDGTFYRGTFMPDELLEKFANGEEVEMPEYLSTSSDPAKADRAAENSKSNGRKGEKVVLEVTTDNGRNIDPLSRYQGKESEVLIPRGGKFVKTGEKTKIIGGKEYKVIEVKQVG